MLNSMWLILDPKDHFVPTEYVFAQVFSSLIAANLIKTTFKKTCKIQSMANLYSQDNHSKKATLGIFFRFSSF